MAVRDSGSRGPVCQQQREWFTDPNGGGPGVRLKGVGLLSKRRETAGI